MFNAINKTIMAGAILAIALSGCSDKENLGAQELYSKSEAAIQASDFSGALVLLDTLNSRYPKQTQIRKDALRLRAEAMQGIALDSIASESKTLAEATIKVDEWRPKFRHVDSSVGLEGYFIPKNAPEKVMTSTGIQPRVSEKGFFYIVANVEGRSIGLRSLEFVDGNELVSSSAISPARIVKVEGSESASFNPEDLEGIGEWLLQHPNASKLIIKGAKGNATVKIDKALRGQLTDCYQYGAALQALHLASVKREKYERMLATSRDQLDNLPVPEKQK